MPTAKKLPSGAWRCQYYAGKRPDGSWIRKSATAATKKEAERLAALRSMEAEAAASAPLSFLDAARQYIDNRRGVLSPWTITTYERILKRDFKPLELLTIDEITSDRAQAFVSDFALTHSPKSTASVYGLLSAIVQSAAPDRRLHVRLPQRRPAEMSIPDKATVQRMIAESEEPLRTAVVLASSMGLRRAEICALTWADVRNDRLHVRRALAKASDGAWVLKDPKSEHGTRVLQIPPAAVPYLQPPADSKPADPIVPLTPDALTRRFERLCAALGVRYHFHALRHYYASVLLALNVPDKYAMQRMGHATNNMLKQVYQHTMQDQQQSIDDQISNYFV